MTNTEIPRIKAKTGITSELLAKHLGRCSIEQWDHIEPKLPSDHDLSKAINGLESFYTHFRAKLNAQITDETKQLILSTDQIDFGAPLLFFVGKQVFKDLQKDNPNIDIRLIDETELQSKYIIN